MARFLVLCLWLMVLGCMTVAAQTAEMVVFDLVSSFAVNSTIPGVMALSFGVPPQEVNVLVAFYTNSEAAAHVPAGALCSTTGPTWNPVLEPREGDYVSTAKNESAGVKVVRWTASKDERINISLQKGRGGSAVNVSAIEVDIANDGEYMWDARATFVQANLSAAADYSLLLWTRDPPQQSVSGFFSLGPTANITSDSGAGVLSEQISGCLADLRAHGGYYNQSADMAFTAEELIEDTINNPDTAYEVQNLAVGSTSLSWSSWSDGSDSAFQLEALPINLIGESSLGMGMVGLNVLQRARMSEIPEMDIVALDLGTATHPGSVVMGGYDNALIDHSQKTVFSKTETGGFGVLMTKVKYIGPTSEKTVVSSSASDEESKVALAYDSPNIQLSAAALAVLLPLIGSPTFSPTLNGYIYPSGAPPTDYSLRITLTNGSTTADITVPAASLLTTTSPNNPLSPLTTARTYLRLSPASSPSSAYLGRSFLQHVYVINAPSTISKFHLSAIPSPPSASKTLIPASSAAMSLFNTSRPRRTTPALAPMLGGILGGLALIAIATTAYLFLRRRRNNNHQKQVHFVTTEAGGKISSNPSYDSEKALTSPRTGQTSLSSFSRDLQSFALPPPKRALSVQRHEPESPPRRTLSTRAYDPEPTSPPPPAKDPELLRRLSQQAQQRKSEASTVARDPSTPQVEDISEPASSLQRTATVGRFISAGRVAKVESERSPRGTTHVRTASVGRMCTPTSVEFSVGRGSRGKMRWSGSGSGSEGGSSVFGLDAVTKEAGYMKEEEKSEGESRPSTMGTEEKIILVEVGK